MDPPSSDCAPQPVGMAIIVVSGPGGAEVARGTTGSDGTVVLEVAAGQILRVTVDYDTGIR